MTEKKKSKKKCSRGNKTMGKEIKVGDKEERNPRREENKSWHYSLGAAMQ